MRAVVEKASEVNDAEALHEDWSGLTLALAELDALRTRKVGGWKYPRQELTVEDLIRLVVRAVEDAANKHITDRAAATIVDEWLGVR